MAHIALLLPRESMYVQAKHIIQTDDLDIHKVKVISTKEAIEEARIAIDEGAQIIVARGVQARLIKEYTNIPVVDIVLSAQEVGLLVMKCKQMVNKEYPRIAIVSYRNMIGDISYLGKLLEVEIVRYYVESFEGMESSVVQAVAEKADIILGGDIVDQICNEYNIPFVFMESTEDSIRHALFIAQKISYAIDVEQSSKAQFETMLDTAFNGIVKIDKERKIIVTNHMIEELIGKTSTEVQGELFEKVFDDIDVDVIIQILSGERDMYSSSSKIRGVPLLILIAPIQYGESIMGAIVSCRRLKSNLPSDTKRINDIYINGYIAKNEFSDLKTKETSLKRCIEFGKKYSLSQKPILIMGENGTEKEEFAQCIHNNSNRRKSPFLVVDCSTIEANDQYSLIFGNQGIKEEREQKSFFELANQGTIYFANVDRLSLVSQTTLCNFLKMQNTLVSTTCYKRNYDIRIVASSSCDLSLLVKHGQFYEELYYTLNACTIQIPPLRKRKKDIPLHVNKCLKLFVESYQTYLMISDKAMEVLTEYSWEGNLLQLENFCDRLFLTTTKKKIDESLVKSLMDELYPDIKNIDGQERMVVYKHPEAIKMKELLEKYNGNRNAVAQEMNISTTTLWRRMKKYGILNKYDL